LNNGIEATAILVLVKPEIFTTEPHWSSIMKRGPDLSAETEKDLPRRRFLAAAGLSVTAAWLAPRSLLAADDGIVGVIKEAAATSQLSVQPLRGNISVIMGSGGNVAVLPGPDGKLLIDAGIAVSRPRMTEVLAGISDDPIRHLVNTHWHFDHTDGNNWLHTAGAAITAHENTRKRLLVRHRVQGWHFTFPPAPSGALPTTTFKKNLTLNFNGAHINLDYYEPAHTDSDICVHFTDADVMHVADTFWNGVYPFIDYSSGGNIDGSIAAAELNAARAGEKTIVIPGHGPIGNKSDLVEIREKVAALKEAGRTLEQTQAAKPTAAYDEKWGKFVITPDAFTELVYQGV
jgi:glyoxylase-like metal-dependent hydrolase (beta-lactamase superfamily II)